VWFSTSFNRVETVLAAVNLSNGGDYSGFCVGYSCRHAGLIKGIQEMGTAEKTLSQRLPNQCSTPHG